MNDLISNETELRTFLDKRDIDIRREYLSAINELKENNLPYIHDIKHLSDIADVSNKQLRLFMWDKDKAYCRFTVKKKTDGYRKIDAPCKKLKKVQRWILDNVLYKPELPENVHGFVPGKSIFTNAEPHVNQDLVLGVDIKKFFPSINKNRVFGLFNSLGYTRKMSSDLAEVCTFKSSLPQGSPCSPMIANLISRKLDKRLSTFCEEKDYVYTRYADDITISGDKDIPKYVHLIYDIIEDEGFEVNKEKTRILGRGSQQKVTGLIVNDKVSVGKKERKRLEAIVHNITQNGPLAENKEKDPHFKEKLIGKIEHASNAHPDFADKLLDKLDEVDWKKHDEILKEFKEDQKIKKNIKKSSYQNFILYNDLEFFEDIDEAPPSEIEILVEEVDDLKEKCTEHSKENCKNCLLIPKEKHKNCLKHILGRFIGETGGTHHGHEVYDIGGMTNLEELYVFVVFILKSKLDRNEKDRLLRQFFDLTEEKSVDVLSIVSSDNLDNDIENRIKRLIKVLDEEKYYCLIQRRELCDIWYNFKEKIDY
ncbi:MAG: retron St85 family RNA-directed DNA polymerase [Atribacterota bacterium]